MAVAEATHCAQTIVDCPSMVDHSSLILPLLATQGSLSTDCKALKSIRVMDSLESNDLWGFRGGYHP